MKRHYFRPSILAERMVLYVNLERLMNEQRSHTTQMSPSTAQPSLTLVVNRP